MNSKRAPRSLLLILCATALSACSTLSNYEYAEGYVPTETSFAYAGTPIAASPAPALLRKSDKPIVQIEVINTDQDFEEWEYDPDNSPIDTRLPVVGRERRGFRFGFGAEAARGYVQLFAEEVDFLRMSTNSDGGGIGGGVDGVPVVGRAGENVKFILPYRAGINVVGLSDSAADIDTGYVELEIEFGFGVEFFGVRLQGGFTNSSVGGYQEDENNANNDADLDGSNSATYFEARYKHPKVPVYLGGRIEDGDIEQDAMVIFGFEF